MPLKRTKNPEVLLMEELEAAVQGSIPATQEYLMPVYNDPVRAFENPGSDNWPIVSLATRFWLKPEENVEAANAYYQRSESAVWDRETGSRDTYHEMHLKAALAILTRSNTRTTQSFRDLSALVTKQLQWLYGMYLAGEDSRGWVGQRSANTPVYLPWLDGFFRWGTGRILAKAESRWIRADKVVSRCIGTLKTALQPVRFSSAYEILSSLRLKTLSPYFVYMTAGGLAIWTSDMINGNTQAVLGYVWDGKNEQWLPKDRGPDGFFHQRSRKPGASHIVDTGKALVYTSPVYGDQMLALPVGPPVAFYQFGGAQAFVDLRSSVTPTPPIPTPSPEPTEPPTPPQEPPKPRPSKMDWIYSPEYLGELK